MASPAEGQGKRSADAPPFRGGPGVSALMDKVVGRSEFGVAAILAGLGVLAIVDALSIPKTSSQATHIGPEVAPIAVGLLLIVVAVVLAFDVAKGGRGEAEAGEDVDLGKSSDWLTILILAAAFLGNAVLMERLGWPISGALLFVGAAYALGARKVLWTAAIAVALSFGSYYLFVLGLDLHLPAGLLQGIV